MLLLGWWSKSVLSYDNLTFSFFFLFQHGNDLALMHYDFDGTLLSLDTVYKGLNHDRETYYLLWIAVRKVLAEEHGAGLTT